MTQFYNHQAFTDLNDSQKEAVKNLDGPLLVLSGAGTGKTRVLTARLANLLYSNKTKPWNILAVTFTNKAAKEMRIRLESLIGPSANSVWLGTFHSIAARILRENAEVVGLNANYTIITPDDQIRLLKQIMIDQDIDIKKFTPKAMSNLISSWKDKGYKPDDINQLGIYMDIMQFTKILLTSRVMMFDITDGATFYHADYVMPSWAKSKIKTIEIGDHIFYRWKR